MHVFMICEAYIYVHSYFKYFVRVFVVNLEHIDKVIIQL